MPDRSRVPRVSLEGWVIEKYWGHQRWRPILAVPHWQGTIVSEAIVLVGDLRPDSHRKWLWPYAGLTCLKLRSYLTWRWGWDRQHHHGLFESLVRYFEVSCLRQISHSTAIRVMMSVHTHLALKWSNHTPASDAMAGQNGIGPCIQCTEEAQQSSDGAFSCVAPQTSNWANSSPKASWQSSLSRKDFRWGSHSWHGRACSKCKIRMLRSQLERNVHHTTLGSLNFFTITIIFLSISVIIFVCVICQCCVHCLLEMMKHCMCDLLLTKWA